MSHSKQLYFYSCKLGGSACLIHMCEYNRAHYSYLEMFLDSGHTVNTRLMNEYKLKQ